VRLRRFSAGAGLVAGLLLLAAQPVAADSHRYPVAPTFETTRTFDLAAGRASRTFTFREHAGVILLNSLTVPRGVHVIVSARIPHIAGVRARSWPSPSDPALNCRPQGSFEVCNQGEEWCPMPEAVWHMHLVKLKGPAGPIRFNYLVAPPPKLSTSHSAY
jgi:hypothetical protein